MVADDKAAANASMGEEYALRKGVVCERRDFRRGEKVNGLFSSELSCSWFLYCLFVLLFFLYCQVTIFTAIKGVC